jgi:hypothetical protein
MSVQCAAALAALDRVLEQRPDALQDELKDAIRCLVQLRSELTAEHRLDRNDAKARQRLDRTNAVLSVLIGGEYPLVGVRWSRIKQAREDLTKLLDTSH